MKVIGTVIFTYQNLVLEGQRLLRRARRQRVGAGGGDRSWDSKSGMVMLLDCLWTADTITRVASAEVGGGGECGRGGRGNWKR